MTTEGTTNKLRILERITLFLEGWAIRTKIMGEGQNALDILNQKIRTEVTSLCRNYVIDSVEQLMIIPRHTTRGTDKDGCHVDFDTIVKVVILNCSNETFNAETQSKTDGTRVSTEKGIFLDVWQYNDEIQMGKRNQGCWGIGQEITVENLESGKKQITDKVRGAFHGTRWDGKVWR